eukprot:scaffold2355_cov382-Prasinococcus_capsulatus_cf.AAC.9
MLSGPDPAASQDDALCPVAHQLSPSGIVGLSKPAAASTRTGSKNGQVIEQCSSMRNLLRGYSIGQTIGKGAGSH